MKNLILYEGEEFKEFKENVKNAMKSDGLFK